MKRDQFRESANNQSASQVENSAETDSLDDTDLQEYESSAGFYERRWRHRVKYDHRDWWIVAAVYVLLASVAFVTL
jgi:uncharacterized membrane protein